MTNKKIARIKKDHLGRMNAALAFRKK